VPLFTRSTRLRARPFMLAWELIELVKLGLQAHAPEMDWLLRSNIHQLTATVPTHPPLPELEIREIWSTWADLVGAQRLAEAQLDGVVRLKAVVEAYGDYLVRLTIEAELPSIPPQRGLA
jgi:hypothetical protein